MITHFFRAGILVAVFAMMSSCAASQNKGPQPTKDNYIYKGVTDNSCAVEMAFGSMGAGIDRVAMDKVMKLISTYKVEYTSKPIGKEGEVRMCMPLKELNKTKKKEFVEALKKIAKDGQLVSVSIR